MTHCSTPAMWVKWSCSPAAFGFLRLLPTVPSGWRPHPRLGVAVTMLPASAWFPPECSPVLQPAATPSSPPVLWALLLGCRPSHTLTALFPAPPVSMHIITDTSYHFTLTQLAKYNIVDTITHGFITGQLGCSPKVRYGKPRSEQKMVQNCAKLMTSKPITKSTDCHYGLKNQVCLKQWVVWYGTVGLTSHSTHYRDDFTGQMTKPIVS